MVFKLSDIREDHATYNLVRASLLQKLIRRNMIEEALYVGTLFLDDGHTKGLFRRLQIIAAEDIGLSWKESHLFMNENKENLLLIIQALAEAPKNRECDRFLLLVADKSSHLNKLDSQAQNEISILEKFFELSSLWFNDKNKKNFNYMKEEFKKMFTGHGDEEIIQVLLENYIELTRGKIHGARCQMSMAALLLSRNMPSFGYSPAKELKHQPKPFDEIFDFALDMHTPIGKKLGRGFDHWLKNGTLVIPEKKYPELLDSQGIEKYPLY